MKIEAYSFIILTRTAMSKNEIMKSTHENGKNEYFSMEKKTLIKIVELLSKWFGYNIFARSYIVLYDKLK